METAGADNSKFFKTARNVIDVSVARRFLSDTLNEGCPHYRADDLLVHLTPCVQEGQRISGISPNWCIPISSTDRQSLGVSRASNRTASTCRRPGFSNRAPCPRPRGLRVSSGLRVSNSVGIHRFR